MLRARIDTKIYGNNAKVGIRRETKGTTPSSMTQTSSLIEIVTTSWLLVLGLLPSIYFFPLC